MVFQLATAQDLHHAQYLGPNDIPPTKKKSSTLHRIAILVPHVELVTKP